MKTQILFIAFFFILYFVASANPAFAQNKQEERQVANFTKVEISGPFNVVISPDGSEQLTLEGEEDKLPQVITEVVGNRLIIRYEREHRWFRNENVRRNIRVRLSVKQLEHISVAAGADVLVKGTLKADQLTIHSSSAGNVEAYVEANELTADCSSGGDIKAERLIATRCSLSASSGGDISITVKEELAATASSGGDIRYKGNPPQVKVRSSSGGDVRGKN